MMAGYRGKAGRRLIGSAEPAVEAALLTNLVAWAISIAVTVLIVAALYLPNWQERLIAGVVTGLKRQTGEVSPDHAPK